MRVIWCLSIERCVQESYICILNRIKNVQGKIPVVILNWNNASDTIECLDSLRNLRSNNFHVFLIDNNSEEGDRQELERYACAYPNLTFVSNGENLGFGKAHNRLIERFILNGSYRYVVLLNNDTTVEPDWLDTLVACAEEEGAGMVSCKMLNYNDHSTVNNLGHKFQNTGDILPIANNEPAVKYNRRFVNEGASGGAALYSVSMLRDIGLYDEYFFCGYEDAELGLRAMIAGYKLVYEPRSIVYHKVSASVDKVRNYEFTLKIQLDIMYSYFKLMPWAVVVVNAPFALVRNAMLLVIFALFGRMKYVRVFFHGWWLFVTRDRKATCEARRKARCLRRISSMEILARQEFFFWDNLKRFNNYFLKGNKTIFEKF